MTSLGVVHFLLCSSLLFYFCTAHKTFVFKSSPEEESKWTKFKGKVIPKVKKAGKYLAVPPPLDVNSSDSGQSLLRDIPEEAQFDPCSTSERLCLNGGKCTNDRGKFYCNCDDKHYGRRCELVANKAACVAHSCKNGGVCYSTPDSQKIVDRKKLEDKYDVSTAIKEYAECRKKDSMSGDACEREKKKGKTETTKEDFNDISQTVNYRCQCPQGFHGPLCDYTRQERLCDEDFCMGHGFAVSSESKCSCACEPEYTGEHCETLLPCSTFQCHNEGICYDKYDETTDKYTASCVCPQSDHKMTRGMIKIEGEHCEILTLDKDLATLDPCGKPTTYFEQITNFQVQYRLANPDDDYNLEVAVMNKLCNGDINNCQMYDINLCNNLEGICGVVAAPMEDNLLFPLPRCACPPLHTGDHCEGKLESLCHTTREENDNGITFESRCTSESHGTCAVNANNERYCVCEDDYVGEKCETYAPCARKPCGLNAECIPLPFEQSAPGEQSYRCICDVGDEQNGNKCIYNGKGKCAGKENPCNHGKCVSCPDTSGDESSICNEDEQTRGFRCICAPGFAPPFCRNPFGPCEAHLCLNEGICKVNKEHTYDCSCAPGTSGDYCGNIDDYCEFIGNRKCGNSGTCSNTNLSIRGFLCTCEWEYRGADCEVFAGKLAGFYQIFDENYMYTYPIVALFFCIIFLILTDFLCGDKAERKKRKGEKTSVSSANPPSKTSKKSISSKRAEGSTDTPVPNIAAASTPLTPPLAVQPVVVPIPSTPVKTQ